MMRWWGRHELRAVGMEKDGKREGGEKQSLCEGSKAGWMRQGAVQMELEKWPVSIEQAKHPHTSLASHGEADAVKQNVVQSCK